MSLWSRITNAFKSSAEKREDELLQMSPAERRYAEEPVEDHAADEFAEEHLGGTDPDRLVEDE
jgi:hypothetical protein